MSGEEVARSLLLQAQEIDSPKPSILKYFRVASYSEPSPPRFRGVGVPDFDGTGVLFQGTAFRMPRHCEDILELTAP